MSAFQKEQIYTKLREYHLDEFSEVLSNPSMNELLSEYRELEDEIIAMLLGLANGKSEFVDFDPGLTNFTVKAKPTSKVEDAEQIDRKHFVSKAMQLQHIVQMAKQASFTLRPPRKTRLSTRAVETKITKA